MQVIKVPKHIAFIMDGNGRWATKRHMERNMGHKKGAEVLRKVLQHCYDRGIKVVSVYAFSTENFKRSEKEVNGIFRYAEQFLDECKNDLMKNEIKFCVLGDYKDIRVPQSLTNKIEKLIEETKNHTNAIVNVALVYGGRAEIVRAVNNAIKSGKTELTEQDIADNLYTVGQPEPDLIVRASGEQRVSNFMLWQNAYSEFYFPKTLWPDFNEKMVDKCLKVYSKRNRRFGKV